MRSTAFLCALRGTLLWALCCTIAAATAPPAPQDAQGEPEALRLRPGRAIVPETPVDLPMTMRGQQPAVEVFINDEGPFLFAIDTGGQGAARVDSSLLEKLGLEVIGQVQGSDPSGRQTVGMDRVRLASIRVGDAVFEDVQALSRDYNSRARGLPHIDGILCYHLFSEHVLTLDYPGRRVAIERGPLAAPAGAEFLPLTNQPDATPAIRANIAGVDVEHLLIDSGKMGGIMVPDSIVERLPLRGEPVVVGRARSITGEFEIKRAQLDGLVSFGAVRIEDPHLEFSGIMESTIIGSGALAKYRLTLDPAQNKAWIRTPEREKELREAAPGKTDDGRPGPAPR